MQIRAPRAFSAASGRSSARMVARPAGPGSNRARCVQVHAAKGKGRFRQSVGTPQQMQPQMLQQTPPVDPENEDRLYFNFTGFPFPIGPFFERRTVVNEVVKGQVWTFEQTQSLDVFEVFTPVRMTVIKLKSGGLWVHAPIAPTEECVRLLRDLGAPVEFIVLPTFAYEHKVFVGPFSRRFPEAKVYTAPFQWSFPLNLPPQFFGIFPAGEVTQGAEMPWSGEIDHRLFLPPSIGVGDYVRFSEVAFFHRPSSTLMVTDAVVFVPEEAPEVISTKALLYNARDGLLQRSIAGGKSREEVAAIAKEGYPEDTPENRRLGWQRMCLLVLYFSPSDLLTPQASFAAISNRLLVGPVVQTLVYSKVPRAVCDWVDDICASWRFERVIPCHMAAPVKAGPAEFKAAFDFAYEAAGREPPAPQPAGGVFGGLSRLFGGGGAGGGGGGEKRRPLEADLRALKSLDSTLLKLGAVYADAETRGR
ncbi:hypothetical protein Rsub_12035 [Raphidocelis subcapitata]|uniref:DUF4336 domain-containing protein n=1 Tax=Raphidocelis subcapitata TaxID=307507 RepID=A0A2V0PQ05_9CHLO|nr:hypothetical protein Rsub_12035 [Raphidocelis subcapitata]|eukprot:GBF99275.1 hypothetical protein Rsub_12035 [Raphidocelis subcapitata]